MLLVFTPLLLILNCFFIYFFRKWLGPIGIFALSVLVLVVSFFIFLFNLYYCLVWGYYTYFDFGRWFFLMDLIDSNLIFVFDNLSILSTLLILFLSIFAQYFGSEYMYREAFINRLLYLLNMFITSVVFLFIVYDFFLVLIVWELIGLFSLLLVNYYSTRVYTLKAALKTFLLSRLSDMFIFFAFLFFVIIFYSTDFSVIFIKIPFFIFFNIYLFSFGLNIISSIALLIAGAGAIKAAQFLFHTWLPDAMEAPTPASALIHSSTLVIMGIYFIIRFGILFEFTNIANIVLIMIGSLTIAFGSICAAFQNDIKKLVAYSTISQMGYLFCGCGFLCYNEVLFYLTIHAVNKAFLFITVGYIVHFFLGNTDLRFMGSLYFYSIDLVFILIFLSLNLTGLPYSSGFLAKEFLLFQTLRDETLLFFIRGCWFVSFFFTPLYMLLLNILVFFSSKNATARLFILVKNNYKFIFTKRGLFNLSLIDHSLVFSKLTGLVLLVFFVVVNLVGEWFLTICFNFTTLTSLSSIQTLNFFSFNLSNLITLFSSLLLNSINYFIFIFFFFSIKYLKNIFY